MPASYFTPPTIPGQSTPMIPGQSAQTTSSSFNISPVTLQGGTPVPIPKWLRDQSASQPLKNFQRDLPGLFDTSGLQTAANQWRDTSMARFEKNADAMARAAQNRAMISGGRVGSSFAKGGLMLSAMNEGNRMNYDYARLAAQMLGQRAGLQGQAAGQLADYGQRRQGMMSDWVQGQQRYSLSGQELNQRAALAAEQRALERERLAQQESQFARSFGLQSAQTEAELSALALRNLGPGAFNYNMAGGMPMSLNDAMQKGMADDYRATRAGLISQMQGPSMSYGSVRDPNYNAQVASNPNLVARA